MITIDVDDFKRLSDGLTRYANAFPKSQVSSALRKAAKPMLTRANQLVPVSNNNKTRVSLKKKKDDYRVGGATKQDLRIKSFKPQGTDSARVLVGVSHKSGKVGWRTHFITGGVRGGGRSRKINIKADDFIQRSYDLEINGVEKEFYKFLFSNYIKWGKLNLPQNQQ